MMQCCCICRSTHMYIYIDNIYNIYMHIQTTRNRSTVSQPHKFPQGSRRNCKSWVSWCGAIVLGGQGFLVESDMGVNPKIGGKFPQNGWCYFMENPIKMGWFGGKTPYFWFNTHIPIGRILVLKWETETQIDQSQMNRTKQIMSHLFSCCGDWCRFCCSRKNRKKDKASMDERIHGGYWIQEFIVAPPKIWHISLYCTYRRLYKSIDIWI